MKKIILFFTLHLNILFLVYAAPYNCNLAEYMEVPQQVDDVLKVEITAQPSIHANYVSKNALLFKRYPLLAHKIMYASLADLPTPIEQLKKFGARLGVEKLYIKRDDLTGKKNDQGIRHYGGNKVRKLEFLLADAIQRGADTVVTYGCVGSNHAVATAIYAQQLGLDTILQLKHQPNSYNVRKNLHLMDKHGGRLQWYPTVLHRDAGTLHTFLRYALDHNKALYFIPTGGSCVLGVLGYVNAVFELQEQIKAGAMPEPDYIYVPVGSVGTITGLLLGLKVTGLASKLIGVATERASKPKAFEDKIVKLFNQTNTFLHALDDSFPLCHLSADQITIHQDFCGNAYGLYTTEGMQALEWLKKDEHILLDGTYTAKTAAALVHDAHSGMLKDKVVLYWHTFCYGDDSGLEIFDYKKLPHCLWRYFESDVQKLDVGPLEKRKV